MSKEPNKAAQLEAGYTAWHRTYELSMIVVTVCLAGLLVHRVAKCQPLSGWWMPLAALVGILFADFLSGVVHWAFDTWGSVDTPIFGRLAIRTFRHHHVDAKAITRHDFVETNGHNFGLTLPVSISSLLYIDAATASLFDVFVGMSAVFSVFFVSLTSQIHKWAHADHTPYVIQLLQRARIILSPEHHANHHAAPYNRNYCITVGWLNGPLRSIRFFETLERMITAISGAVPREDDLGKDAALREMPAKEAENEDGAVARD